MNSVKPRTSRMDEPRLTNDDTTLGTWLLLLLLVLIALESGRRRAIHAARQP
jgi:MYXO-CTERM domain-containing protein